MKILVVSPKFHPVIGGGETFALNSIEELIKAGNQVAIAVEPHRDRNLGHYAFPVFEIAGLSDSNLDVLKAPDGLHKLLRRYKPDIVHVHGYFGLLAFRLSNQNIPVVCSIHSTPVWGERIVGGMSGFEQEKVFAEQVLRLTRPQAIIGANKVYTDAANKLVPAGVEVEYFPYPILNGFFTRADRNTYRTDFALKPGDILITVPSRIIERKGIREAVEALSQLDDNFYLCLPGAFNPLDLRYWESIKSSPAYKTSLKRIIIPSSELLPEQMPGLYASSDIILMPSYYEGAPVATVEAMAAGIPFVGADSQGINSFIRHAQNGLLVPKKSITELVDAIKLLASNENLRKKLTRVASKEVSHLSWERQLPNLMKLYQKYTN